MWKQVDSLTQEVIGLFLQSYAKFLEDVELDRAASSEGGFHP